MNKILITLAILITLSTSTQAYDHFSRAKHPSMGACLNYIQTKIGNKYRIMKDTPDEVSGLFGEKLNKGFSCEVKRTGTQGTYVQSSYSTADRP